MFFFSQIRIRNHFYITAQVDFIISDKFRIDLIHVDSLNSTAGGGDHHNQIFNATRVWQLADELDDGVSAIDFSYRDSLMYWSESDVSTHVLNLTKAKHRKSASSIITTTQHRRHRVKEPWREYMREEPGTQLQAVAVDWLADNLYLAYSPDGTHFTSAHIAVVNNRQRKAARKLLMWENVEEIISLMVVPPHGLMFWSVVDGIIESAAMDGSERRVFLREKGVRSPVSLCFDYEARRLYWADRSQPVVASVALDGSDYRTVARGLHQVHGVSLLGRHLFWTSRSSAPPEANVTSTRIYVLRKETGERVGVVDVGAASAALTYQPVYDLKVFHADTQPSGGMWCVDRNTICLVSEVCENI